MQRGLAGPRALQRLERGGGQHVLTTAYPDHTSTAIGGYMVFYSLGSAFGAAATGEATIALTPRCAERIT